MVWPAARARPAPGRSGQTAATPLRHRAGVAADPPSGRELPARDLRRAQHLAAGFRGERAPLSQPGRPNLRHHLQSRAPLVLVAAHAARGGAGIQSLRLFEGRPRPLVRPHRFRGPDLATQCAAAREHRNPHTGVFLKPATAQPRGDHRDRALRDAVPPSRRSGGCFAAFPAPKNVFAANDRADTLCCQVERSRLGEPGLDMGGFDAKAAARRMACLIVLAAATADAALGQPVTLRIGFGMAAEEPLWVLVAKPDLAKNHGKAYALDATRFTGSDKRSQAFEAGAIDLAASSANGVIFAAAE